MGYYVTEFVVFATHAIHVDFSCEHCGKENHAITTLKEEETCEYQYQVKPKDFILDPEKHEKMKHKVMKNLQDKLDEAKRQHAKGNYSFIDECSCQHCKKHPSWLMGRLIRNFIFFMITIPVVILLLGLGIPFFLNDIYNAGIKIGTGLISSVIGLSLAADLFIAKGYIKSINEAKKSPVKKYSCC